MKEAPSARLFLSGFEHDNEVHADGRNQISKHGFLLRARQRHSNSVLTVARVRCETLETQTLKSEYCTIYRTELAVVTVHKALQCGK
jgi:hypothetical protein